MTNEQIRLFAAYLNIAAASFMVAALVTQPVAWAIADKGRLVADRPVSELSFVFVSFALSILFHLAAQLTIRRTRDEP